MYIHNINHEDMVIMLIALKEDQYANNCQKFYISSHLHRVGKHK